MLPLKLPPDAIYTFFSRANLERDDLVDCDPDLALRVWNRAHLFGDDDLAKVMLPEAIEVPLINIPRELIGEITASALMALVSRSRFSAWIWTCIPIYMY